MDQFSLNEVCIVHIRWNFQSVYLPANGVDITETRSSLLFEMIWIGISVSFIFRFLFHSFICTMCFVLILKERQIKFSCSQNIVIIFSYVCFVCSLKYRCIASEMGALCACTHFIKSELMQKSNGLWNRVKCCLKLWREREKKNLCTKLNI